MDAPFRLDTPRMHLRPIRPDDLEALIALDADPEVVRFITGGLQLPRAAYVDGILPRMLAAGADDPRLGFFAAHEDGPDGPFLGWFHLRPDVFEPAWLEVGYRLRRSAWGQGLATEGTLALLAHARACWPGVVLSARTMTDNGASRRVMEKCGLALRGSFTYAARTYAGVALPAAAAVLYTDRD
ncbi:MAG: GNAT family N-acetyltransferase [Myxococcota bacterium]